MASFYHYDQNPSGFSFLVQIIAFVSLVHRCSLLTRCPREVWASTLGDVTAHGRVLAPVVQTLDSAIHRKNHYPADKYYGNQLRYPLDSDLSGR